MPTTNPNARRAFLLGLSGTLLAVVGLFLLAQVTNAITVEDVGGTLGLGNADLKQTIVNVVKWALGLLGLVAIIVMLYGGFLWMTSRGNEKQIEKAKRTLINGAIGLVIILVSWAIVLFIQRFITNATGNAQASGQCQMSLPAEWGYCNLCDDTLDPRPDFGFLVPDPSCITPDSNTYYADWQNPVHEEADVSLCSAVSAHFTGLTPAAANDISISSTFPVTDGSGNSPTHTVNFFGPTAEFVHPTEDFLPNTQYSVDVNGIISSDGTAATQPPGGWTFTTGTTSDEDPPTVSLTAPTNNETIQCLSPVIEVRFSESMLASSMYNPANFRITPADAAVARIDMPRSDTLQITLDKPLVKNRTYTITLNADTDPNATGGFYSGYKDTCINALDGDSDGTAEDGDGQPNTLPPDDDFSWVFTTADTDTVDCTPVITSVTTPAYHGNPTDPNRVVVRGSNFGLTPRVRFSGNVLATDIGGTNSLCFDDNNIPQRTGSPACIHTDPAIPTPTSARIDAMVPTGPLAYAPNGAMTGPVTVEVAGRSSPPSSNVEVRSPHITGIYPREGKAGRFVTIFGENFGVNGRVRFRIPGGSNLLASTPSCSSTPWSDTQILVQVPEGFTFGDTTFIQVDTDTYADVRGMSNLAQFDIRDVSGPNLCSINPSSSNDPSASLDALGDGFGTNPAVVSTRYSSFAGNLVSLTDDQHLRAAPGAPLANGTYNFFVTVNGVASNPLQYRIPRDPAPAVVFDSSCSTSVPVIRSPNPLPDTADACRNLGVAVRFTESMNPAAAGGTTDPTLFYVSRCNNTATFDPAACSGTVNGTRANATYNQSDDLVAFAPAGDRFDDGYWYQVTVKAGIPSAAGALLPQDVVWHFRVRETGGDCQAEAVGVTPPQIGPLATGQSGVFTALATNNSCSILLGLPGDFNWSSSDTSMASDPTESTVPAGAQPADNTGTTTVQPGSIDGTANISATYSGLTGSGNLIVQRNYCETNTDCATRTNSYGDVCTGAICNVALRTCEPRVLTLQSGSQTGTAVNGPAGNMINVRGCYFGGGMGANGKVTFTNGGNIADGSFAICGPAGWTNDLIRVQAMPDTDPPASANTIWSVQVLADNGLGSNNDTTYTISSQCTTPTNGTTSVPGTGVPILCGTLPPAGREGDAIQYQGARFTASSEAFFSEANGPLNQLPLPGAATTVTPPSTAMSHVAVDTGIPTGGTTAATTIGVPTGGDFCIATPVDFSVSCTQNSECGTTGCCVGNACRPTAVCTNGLISGITPGAGTLQCRNQNFVVTFNKSMRPETVTNTTVYLYDANTNAPVPTSFAFDGTNATFTATDALPNGTYRIRVVGGSAGVTATDNTFLPADYVWPQGAGVYTVDASSRVCTVARVNILEIPPQTVITQDLFTCTSDSCAGDDDPVAGNQHRYRVAAYDSQDNELGLANQSWVEADPAGGTYASSPAGTYCPGNTTSSFYCALARNIPEGTEQLTVNITATQSAGTGTASMPIRAYMCASPWPAPPAWPFRDPDTGTEPTHNFTFSFCRDGGVNGYTLSNPIPSLAPTGNIRKEYIMAVLDDTGRNIGDAIGIRIESNLRDLSPTRWYNQKFDPDTGGGVTEVDGYPALREGRTVYVTADNYAPQDAARPWSYPNVYVVSHTANPRPETVAIFDQILKNLKFNDEATPLPQQLLSDLRYDVKRIHAYSEIVYAIQAYKEAHNGAFPNLESGSYLKNLTMTAWPSWQENLGAQIGITMPQDPQKLWDPQTTPRQAPAMCGTGFDQNTCWNEEDKVAQFPNRSPYTGTAPRESTGMIYRSGPVGSNTSPFHLIGTVSDHFVWHYLNSGFMDAWLDCIDITNKATDVCPGDSVCTGFNMALCSDSFGRINALRNPSPADSTQPTIASVEPASGTRLGGTVQFKVSASDNPGGSGIGRVEFVVRRGGAIVAQSTSSRPDRDGKYVWSWDSRTVLNNTGYSLTVTAFDVAGNAAVFAPAPTYEVANAPGDPTAPVITLGNPNANGYVFTGADVTLTASATDSGGSNTGVSHVDFYLGTSRLGQAPDPACTTGCPGSFNASVAVPGSTIRTFPNGSYTYSVVAYDAYGNSSIRQLSVSVNVLPETTPPAVSFVSPDPAPGISGSTANVVVSATDASGVNRVEIFIGTESTPRTTDVASPYTYTWPLAGYVDGQTYTVRAVAYDRYGNNATATLNVQYHASAGPDIERPTITDVTVELQSGSVVPMEGASLEELVHLRATFTDNVAIQKAELRIDNVPIPLTGSAYTPVTPPRVFAMNYGWNTLPEILGPHTVTITAYDTTNNATTITRSVSVNNRASLEITTPRPGATVADNPTVPITLNITRTCDGTLRMSHVYLGLMGEPLAFADLTTCNRTCTYNWTSRNTTANGPQTLWAIGYDATGCWGGSKVAIVVNNATNDTTPPTIDANVTFDGTPWPGSGPYYVNRAGTITALADDNNGGSGLAEVRIEVQQSGTTLYSQSCTSAPQSPCQLTWNIPADHTQDGAYTVVVNASDVAGNDAPAVTKTVNVDTGAPTAAWVGPASGTTVFSPATITMQASGTDPQWNSYASGISRIEYFNGATRIATGSIENPGGSGIYPAILSAVGTYQVIAQVFDNANNMSATAPATTLTISGADTTPPNVSITNPANDNWFWSGIMSVVASATDAGSGMRDVQFYLDGVPFGPLDTASPYWVDWNTTLYANGQTVSFTARACDNAGNCATSAPRLARAWNGAGAICRTNICSGSTPNCCSGTCQAQACAQQEPQL